VLGWVLIIVFGLSSACSSGMALVSSGAIVWWFGRSSLMRLYCQVDPALCIPQHSIFIYLYLRGWLCWYW
jgi:hypothetical protein